MAALAPRRRQHGQRVRTRSVVQVEIVDGARLRRAGEEAKDVTHIGLAGDRP